MTLLNSPFQELDTGSAAVRLSGRSVHEIVEWASNMFGDDLVMSTGFGIHLPNIATENVAAFAA